MIRPFFNSICAWTIRITLLDKWTNISDNIIDYGSDGQVTGVVYYGLNFSKCVCINRGNNTVLIGIKSKLLLEK